MSRSNPVHNLTRQLLDEIAGGRLEDANRTVQCIGSLSKDPAASREIVTRETLDALQKARTLALVQRSHIQSRIRKLAVRRLYPAPIEFAERSTWRIDG